MSIKLFSLFLLISAVTIFAEGADQINRIKWEKSEEHGTWQGKIGDDWVVLASSRNEHGVSEIQMVTCPGTAKKITIFTDRDEDSKKFRHAISIPEDFPFSVQIETREKNGGLAVSITLNENSFWILFTDPESNLIGINNFP